MAQSYRGLTITIGGDTTKLTKALHTANQAVSGTQSALRKLNDALKLDPTSLNAAQLQVGAFAEQASNAATRLVTLNEAMQQVGNKVLAFNGSAQTVKQFAENWENVNMTVSQTRDYYNNLTKTLAETYTSFSKVHSEASEMASIKMAQNWDLGKMDLSDMLAQLKDMSSSFNANDKQVEKFKKKLTSLQGEYQKLADAYNDYQHVVATETDNNKVIEAAQQLPKLKEQIDAAKESFKSFIESFKGFKSDELFKYDADNTSLESLASALYRMVQAEALTVEQADKMYDSFERMKNMWQSAFEDVKTADVVEGFHDMEAETAKAAAKVQSLVDEMVELSNVSDVAKGLVALKDNLAEINQSGATAQKRLEGILEALKEDRNQNNTFLQREAMREFSEVTAEASEAIKNIREQLDGYDGSIRKMAASTESYAAETAKAKQEYADATAALKGYEGAMEEIENLQNKIKADNPSGFEDDEDYQSLVSTYAEMEKVVEVLKQRFADAKKEKEKFVEVGEVRELTDQLAQAVERAEGFKNINFKPEVDLSSVEGLKKALEAIKAFKFDSDGFDKYVKNVDAATAAVKKAKEAYDSLQSASQKAPKNKDLFRERTEALETYMSKLRTQIYQTEKAIAAMPTDKIDEAAIATNTVEESFVKARNRVEELQNDLTLLEKSMKDLRTKKDEIKPVDEESIKRVEEINAELERLRKVKKELEGKIDIAIEARSIAENTRKVQEYKTNVQAAKAALHALAEEAKKTSNQKTTPKVDEAAFVQVIDRISQAVRSMGKEVVEASNKIDSAYRDMRKTVNGTEAEFEALRDAAMEYSQSHITSADTMLEMQALGGQLGVLTQDLEQFSVITSNLDIATDLDAESVALKLGQISNVLNLDIEGMQGFADALVRLGNNMPAQESAIMAVAQRFGAVASTAKFSGDEILAWSASIAATGQRSEAAATAISNTVSGIEQAIANGGSDLKQFAAIAGMSADEFKDSWAKGPTETLRAFISGLKTLKDSDESAVAALENMGITGVRQQQTLLALTQTIDSLDKALLMSKDAWDGVEDQWGSAGDAAVEAENKSQGFSGALAILKNNAENLAASLGDGLIDPMRLASEIMGFLTDTMNNIPAPMKTTIEMLGLGAIAFGTIGKGLQVFNGGLAQMLVAIKDTKNIGEFVVELLGLSDAFGGAAEAASTLGSIISGPLIGSLGIAIATFGLVYTALKSYYDEQERLSKSVMDFNGIMASAQSGYNTYIANADDATRSVKELREATEAATDAQVQLVDQMSQEWSEVGVNEATIDMLVSRITELASKGSLAAYEQNELVAAIEMFNGLTGESVAILDKQTGKLDTTVHSLREMADAYKGSEESVQAIKSYGEEIKNLASKKELLEEVNKKLDMAKESKSYYTMASGVKTSEIAIGDLTAQAKELEREIAASEDRIAGFIGKMGSLGADVSEVEAALNSEGASLADFGDLTEEQLAAIVREFSNASDKSVDAVERVKNALAGLDSSAGDASDIAKQLEEASKTARTKRYNEEKAAATEFYNSQKAIYDSIYNEQKRSYDHEYDNLKNALDREYNELKRHLDKVYDTKKKEYDRQYDDYKLTLDHELDSLKQANDKKLKDLKRTNEDEESAHKKATDKYLDNLKKRYNESVKLAKAESDAKIKEIDRQIKALDDATEEEQDAIDERKEADKIAELQSDVDKAKSRRKRQEAEKKLNDYLQEVELNRHKRERREQKEVLQQQKEDLKDALTERTEAIKDEYEVQKETYEEVRAGQLEAIKRANEDEYEELKLKLSKEEEALKEANDLRLENMKLAHEDALSELKNSHEDQLNEVKLSQQAQLDALKESQQIALENLKASHTASLQELKAAQNAQLKLIKDGAAEAETVEARSDERRVEETNSFGKKLNESYSNFLDKVKGQVVSGAEEIQRKNEEHGKEAVETTNRQLEEQDALYGQYGEKHPLSYADGFDKTKDRFTTAVSGVAQNVGGTFDGLIRDAESSGFDMMVVYSNSVIRGYNDVLSKTISNVAQSITNMIGFSVPKEGPMSHADKWGPDMVQLIADGIQSKQHLLIHQVERMSEAIEEAFDPTLTVDAAYEALDTIGKNRSNALSAVVESSSAPTVNVSVNLSLSDVSIREDADIERLAEVISQKMAAQAARQIAGRLG